MEVARYNVFINSSKRLTGSTTYFNVNLKQPLKLRNSNNYWLCRIASVNIPHSFKTINSNNNTLAITITRGILTSNHSLIVPDGNYSISTLLTTIQGLILAIFQSVYAYTPTFSFTYNPNTQYVTLGITGDATTTTISFTFLNNFIGLMMGFTTNQTIGFSPTLTATSTQSVLVNPISYICLRSDTLIQNQAFESIVEQDVQSDILAKIPIVDLPKSWIYYEPPISVVLTNKVIDNIQVYLTNNLDYNLLDLNGLEWAFTIVFTEMTNVEIQDENKLGMDTSAIMDLQMRRQEIIDKLQNAKQKIKSKLPAGEQ